MRIFILASICVVLHVFHLNGQLLVPATTKADIESIRAFRDRLRILHLSETSNNEADYNIFVDIYDVFN